MDITFNCPHCAISLEVDSANSGERFDCPFCHQALTVPTAESFVAAPVRSLMPPIESSVGVTNQSSGEKRFSVPIIQSPVSLVIQKPNKSLEAMVKESKPGMRVKTIRHSDCKESGKNLFDDTVSEFLNRVGDTHIVSITPINYSYVDVATQRLLTDFGVMVVYRQ
ncbi:MAG: hypothetical protein EXS25_02140 [Pedosphaera sp.]|nr:hypothetical protein [Pedosphaera sp.]